MRNLLERVADVEEALIGQLLESNISLEETLNNKKKKAAPLTLKEKKMVLSELKEISNIEFVKSNGSNQLVFHFKRIDLFLDSGDRAGSVDYRKIPFYYLWKLGFINFKTSKSKVVINIQENGLSGFNSVYENDRQRNFHDWGLNCWGGWSSVINGLIDEKKFYDAALHIVSRMKQATVNDNGISTFEKMCQFQYETKPYILLNDQEVEFFSNEIIWLTNSDYDVRETRVREFIRDTSTDLYYVDMLFQNHSYRLAISSYAYERIIRG